MFMDRHSSPLVVL